MSLPWYKLVSAESPLDQGDLIFDCPVAGWKDVPIELSEGGEVARFFMRVGLPTEINKTW